MLVALSVRRLKPGHYDDFRRAWEPEKFPDPLQRAFHVRKVGDPDEVVSFGFLDANVADMERLREEFNESADAARQAAMAPHVEETLVDALYEVVDEVVPSRV
jgi:hypothetical protein